MMGEPKLDHVYEPEVGAQLGRLGAVEDGFGSKVASLDDFGYDDDGRQKRTATVWTASAHLITAVIGSGVLGLGYAIAQIGWVLGPITLLLFAAITIYCAGLLCEAYRCGDELTGSRNHRYLDVVKNHLGPKYAVFAALIQYVKLFAGGIGYTVTGSLCLVAAKRAVCFHEHHHLEPSQAPCSFDNVPWIIFFGALQLVFSQIPDLAHAWWLSYLAATLSFAYAGIGLGLSIGKATEKVPNHGTAWGANHSITTSHAKATWNIFVAVGTMAFAYNTSTILIEIEDTIAQPPKVNSEAREMKKAVRWSLGIATFFYMGIGTISYAGFGNKNPGNLVTGFGFFNPYWLVAAANIFVFIHLIGGYQVYMQVFMKFIDTQIERLFPGLTWLYVEKTFYCPGLGAIPISGLRLVTRTIIVCLTTVIALILPFFNAIVSLLGAICFFPLTVFFPTQISLMRYDNARWSRRWILLNLLCIFALLISLCAGIGAVSNIISSLKVYKPFHSVSDSISNKAG